jgi:nucleoside-diphosphate-sugar epimerase
MARRPAATPRRIAVTGAGQGLGNAVAERLRDRPGSADVVAVEAGAPLAAHDLAGAGTVVHLATSYDPGANPAERKALNVGGTAAAMEACRAAGVRRLVMVTSVEVYAPRPHPSASPARPLTERSPLRAQPGRSLTGDLLEMERLADHARRTGLDVTVLRPAALVGAHLGRAYDGQLLRDLSSSRLLALRGVEPLWQLCHADDLLSALELAAVGAASGKLTVACDGWLPQTTVEALSGRRRLELPASVALSTAERLHRLGVTAASPDDLDRLLAPVVVTCARLRAAGWSPAWTNEAALRAHLALQPEAGSRSATPYTAAGATAAVIGTAALVRRARRRRRL